MPIRQLLFYHDLGRNVIKVNLRNKSTNPHPYLPVTLNVNSTSHQSKFVISLLHILPFWLLKLGVILTFSALAMALPSYCQNGTDPSFWAKYGGLKEYLYSNLDKRKWKMHDNDHDPEFTSYEPLLDQPPRHTETRQEGRSVLSHSLVTQDQPYLKLIRTFTILRMKRKW